LSQEAWRRILIHEVEVEAMQAPILIELGNSLCGVPLGELNIATLQENNNV
jgi:hypothetical protein